MNQGPNVRRLIVEKMSRDVVPAGGGLGPVVAFLSDPRAVANGMRVATEWVEATIQAVRRAPGFNPWRDADDEAIAGEILRQIDARRAAAK